MDRAVTPGQLRHYAARRSLVRAGTLAGAVAAMQFVQADPIRAPARAQDLTLRHRVRNYRAGDLERKYERLGIEEDRFVNYGFVTRDLYNLMHPRVVDWPGWWERDEPEIAARILDHVRTHGVARPSDFEQEFGHGRMQSGWGQTSKTTTRVLDSLHYRGHLRVIRRESGNKVFGPAFREPSPLSGDERARELVRVIVNVYAPIPVPTLRMLIRFIRYASPGLLEPVRKLLPALLRDEFATATVDGVTYAWPADEELDGDAPAKVRFLAPFDPVCWDRDRFEHLHGWQYRFEAYTPAPKRIRGYYALPLLWRERLIGWGNFAVRDGELVSDIGYHDSEPASAAFRRELDAELSRLRQFLGLPV